MKNYHPTSWSQQAREMCDRQIAMVQQGYSTIEQAINFFSNSYRPSIIRCRAAKRFGRWVRKTYGK